MLSMGQNQSDDVMSGQIRQVAVPVGGRAARTGRSLLSKIAFFFRMLPTN